MDHDRTLARYEHIISTIPADFRQLAEWAWTSLRADLERHARNCGADPDHAALIAGRLAQLVVKQVYGDIKRARDIPGKV